MQLQINFGSIDASPALDSHVRERIEKALEHLSSRVTRVEAHLNDDKSKRGGADDQRVLLEARPAGRQPLVVEHRGEDLYAVVGQAADKLGRALQREFARQ